MWLNGAPARVTWMEDRWESVAFSEGSEKSAGLEWRDSAEALCYKLKNCSPRFAPYVLRFTT